MSRAFRWSLLAALLLAVSLPYVLAYTLPGGDWVFGGFLQNPIDGQSYLAKMQLGWNGAWRFTPLYTAETSAGAFVFLNYLALGHMARMLGLPLALAAHLARLAGVVIMFSGLVRLYQACLPAPAQKTAAVLATFGAGLGWTVVFFGLLPSDVWVAEIYPFLSAYTNPHFPFGLGLLLWMLVLASAAPRSEGGPRWARLVSLAAMSLLLAAVQPFGVVVLVMVLAIWLAWETILARRLPARLRLLQVLAAGVPGGLYLVYQYAAIRADPVLAAWNAQNLTPAPPVWDFLLSLSPALLLAGAAAWSWLRRGAVYDTADELVNGPGPRLLLAWALGGLLLVYFPFPLQRRFLMGYFVPLAGLAAIALAGLRAQRPELGRKLTRLAVGVSLPTNVVVLLIGLFGIFSHAPELYLSRNEADALYWLRENSTPGELVLAGPEMGLYVPARSAARVIYGHPFETVNAAAEEQAVLAVYRGEVRGEALARFLSEREVDWIIYGPRDDALDGEPPFLDYPLAYESGPVRIYAVQSQP